MLSRGVTKKKSKSSRRIESQPFQFRVTTEPYPLGRRELYRRRGQQMIESLIKGWKISRPKKSSICTIQTNINLFVYCVCFLFWGAVTLVNISLLRNSIHMKVIKQNKFEISSSITIFELDNLEAPKRSTCLKLSSRHNRGRTRNTDQSRVKFEATHRKVSKISTHFIESFHLHHLYICAPCTKAMSLGNHFARASQWANVN